MTETETFEAPVETAELPKTRAKRPAAVLALSAKGCPPLKAIKWPMPLKAARFELNINQTTCSAATTTFKEIKYTYFEFNGASFYVPGHLPADTEYTFDYPENYNFEPMKLDRKEQADKAAAALAARKAAKSEASPDAEPGRAGDASDLESSNENGEGGSTSEPSEAPVEAATEKRKASR